jgi:hypothetical protein
MAKHHPQAPLGPTTLLSAQIVGYAAEITGWPERFLDSQVWAWDDYAGVRYAPLHTTMALRALAARLHVERAAADKPLTLAQHALAEHQAAFRDTEALLLGLATLGDGEIDTPPAPGEWPVRTIIAHLHDVERYFLATILNALDDGPARELSAPEIAARTGEPVAVQSSGSLAEVWQAYARLHSKVQAWLVYLSDDEVQTPSTMWEDAPYPILFRMQRFAAHVREHNNQIAKSLRILNRSPSEGQMLARQMLAALAEVEGLRLGMGNLGVVACDQLALELAERFAPLAGLRTVAEGFTAAVAAGDVGSVQPLLASYPGLAYTRMDGGLSALLYSLERGHAHVVDALRASGMYMTLHEASALGETGRVERILHADPSELASFSVDGYTPLHLASMYGHIDVVALLLAQNAPVNVAARNPSAVQPLHTAVANDQTEVARMLINAGADANAEQDGGYTPLMIATEHDNAPMLALLREAGAREPGA